MRGLHDDNEQRWALARADLEQLEALTAEDRAWLAQHGLDVEREITRLHSELITRYIYR